MSNDNLCPLCGEGTLHRQVGRNTVEYKGQSTDLDFDFSVCDACGSEQSDATQLRKNKRTMVAFKKTVDGLLSGAEVCALREKLGLTQTDAAQVFGGGPVAFSKYETDDVAQSEAMDKLLRLCAASQSAFNTLTHPAEFTTFVTSTSWQNMATGIAASKHKAEGYRRKFTIILSSELDRRQTPRYAA